MVPGAPPDDEELGARLRALRTERGVSLRALAGSLGISPSALSQMERGKMRPSVTRLFQIVSLLDVPLAAAFGQDAAEPEPPAGSGAVVLARAADLPTLSLGDGVRYRRLSPAPSPGFEIYESTYPPGSSSHQDGELLRHHGHELGSVQSGRLHLEIGSDHYDLGPGDSIRFPSATPHRVSNPGAEPAVAIWVNLP
ncbi:XRE family transcriptional regulator [Prauserella shujinwangii]|uniref:XRE family transcriptional regulator n=1 Tax=Prauserella shujinwangii TaxID=1453103 RepID=A0A2T0LWH6_9PSEU|nr:cupin domain-containing protein [Prauserella shujinwangii]PRX48378.1 XRE family transcriptional regulator [Prauserella shujinwangii]